jgi:hypothetical protein
MSEETKYNRRRFLGLATMGVAGAGLGMIGSANAESTKTKSASAPKTKPGTNASFAPLKQIDAGLLNVGYAGPDPRPALQSFYCTAGLTTSTAMSMLLLCWRRKATG